jgi:hypothetical protein
MLRTIPGWTILAIAVAVAVGAAAPFLCIGCDLGDNCANLADCPPPDAGDAGEAGDP